MGYKVGLFTSPQILTVYELIKVNGTEITKLEFENCKDVLEKVLKELDLNLESDLSYFEMVFLIAMIYFKNKGVEILILLTLILSYFLIIFKLFFQRVF